MKHLSAAPSRRPRRVKDIPKALDQVVLRALAKDPADRYQSADEMDADLERVGRGLSVSQARPRTLRRRCCAATISPLRGQRSRRDRKAATLTRPPLPPVAPPVFYDYDEPPRRRALAVAARDPARRRRAVVAGFFVYRQIQDQLNQAKPVGVENYVGTREINAVLAIRRIGLQTDPNHIHRAAEPIRQP